MRLGRWSELSIDSVCQEHEVMRDADANETSGELGSALGGTLMGVSHTPLTLASGGSPMFPLVVRQPASLASCAVTLAGSVHKSRDDNVVRMWVQLKR